VKESVLRRLFSQNPESVADVCRSTGIPRSTVFYWKYKKEAQVKMVVSSSDPSSWDGSKKLSIVIETAGLNKEELSEYCRKNGLYPEQIDQWRTAAIFANEVSSSAALTRKEKSELKKEKQKSRRLEKELNRKDKALAETAALLVLKKKVQEIWGDPEDE
jgi:hypothetical protein